MASSGTSIGGSVKNRSGYAPIAYSKVKDSDIVNKHSADIKETAIDRVAIAKQFDKCSSCLAYSFCSIFMVLANKAIASYMVDSDRNDVKVGSMPNEGIVQQFPEHRAAEGANDHIVHVLPVAFQNFCCIFLLEGFRAFGVIQYKRPLQSYGRISEVMPLSLSFVTMITSGYMCLHHLNVPMVTIFKNVTNLLIVVGEWFFYGECVTWGIFISVSLMLLGAVAAAYGDITFTLSGLAWIVVNCTTSAAYALYMRRLARNTKSLSLNHSSAVLSSDIGVSHSSLQSSQISTLPPSSTLSFTKPRLFKNSLEEGMFYRSNEKFPTIPSDAIKYGGDREMEEYDNDASEASKASDNGNSNVTNDDTEHIAEPSSSHSQGSEDLDLSRHATVFLNNSISLVLLLFVAMMTGEISSAFRSCPISFNILTGNRRVVPPTAPAISATVSGVLNIDLFYVALNTFTGSVGFLLNFAQLWCIGATSATTYAIVGSLNKIPITVVGHMIFQTKITQQGQIFILVNLIGCMIYSYCKIMSKKEKEVGKSKSMLGRYPSSANIFQSFPSSAAVMLLFEKRYHA